MVNPYTKEGVESLCILPYTSVNVRVVNGQHVEIQHSQRSNPENKCQRAKRWKELVKVLTLWSQPWIYSLWEWHPPCHFLIPQEMSGPQDWMIANYLITHHTLCIIAINGEHRSIPRPFLPVICCEKGLVQGVVT